MKKQDHAKRSSSYKILAIGLEYFLHAKKQETAAPPDTSGKTRFEKTRINLALNWHTK